ncbi:MAG TPA: NADH-quinone oxidoreductase subunit NuoN [Burkholderiales bacterium]|nr:NADH-quinone oxidoreductase subunit NuoN [Burkholderiales bacterium]
MDIVARLNLLPALPEIFLLGAVSLILIVDLFLDDAHRYWSFILSLLTLLGCAIITIGTAGPVKLYTFNGMFVDDPLADVLKVFVYVAVAAVLIYSRVYNRTRQLFRGEFFSLALFATLGMMVMISASHFLTLYLGLEMMSLSLYSMVALQRDSATSTEAAMKYFVLGALASGMFLYGVSMVYGATGSLAIADVAAKIAAGKALTPILVFGLVFIVAGLAFKLGAVPFHMWIPDVYQGAPTPVTVLIGSAPKLAAMGFIFRILAEALGAPILIAEWQNMLAILAVLSMAIGNITAIAQTNIKRMLAYSTIAHMGFFLLGILAGTPEGYAAAMFYAVVYVLMTLAAFGMILLLTREGFEAENIDDFKGLNQRSRWYAFLMLLVMFSLLGIPVMLGFWAKLAVLQAAFQAGYTGLVVVAVLLSLVGAFYYLRIVRVMYFDEPLDRSPLVITTDQRALMSVNALALLVLGIAPGWLLALCQHAIRTSM